MWVAHEKDPHTASRQAGEEFRTLAAGLLKQ
jgi:hypothetical protein